MSQRLEEPHTVYHGVGPTVDPQKILVPFRTNREGGVEEGGKKEEWREMEGEKKRSKMKTGSWLWNPGQDCQMVVM